jgi:hypothetical protein
MKKQKFYPKQVAKKLAGREVTSLNEGELEALSFFFKRRRKYGMTIGIIKDLNMAEFAKMEPEDAQVIFENTNSKIKIKMP